jgi:hypothetical protein
MHLEGQAFSGSLLFFKRRQDGVLVLDTRRIAPASSQRIKRAKEKAWW